MLPVLLLTYLVVTSEAGSRCGMEAGELLPYGATVPTRVWSSKTWLQDNHTNGPSALPQAFDWRSVNGTGFTTRVGYQLLPSACGSCWAFAAAGALSDRVKIATSGRLPDFNLAPQGLLDCGREAGSCNGGNPTLAYEFIAKTGLTDETCMPYRGVDIANWGESDCADRMCRRCDRFGTCNFLARNETTRVFVEEHGVLKGVDAMQAEIVARGPIACLMYAHASAFESYGGGVITDTTRYPGTTHAVVVAGWGVDRDGVKHWIVRNSFGTQWGELGYYRQEMGKDIYNMESSSCSWATPKADSVQQLLSRSGMSSEWTNVMLV